jgi:uncharacterized membrane protein
MYAFLSIILIFICPVAFTAKSMMVRHYERKFNILEWSRDAQILENLINCVYLIHLYTASDVPYPTLNDWIFGVMNGVATYAGIQLIALSIVYGKAGPATSLGCSGAIYMTILTTLFLDEPISVLQILGLVVGMLGTVILTSGNYLIELIFK